MKYRPLFIADGYGIRANLRQPPVADALPEVRSIETEEAPLWGVPTIEVAAAG